MRTAEEIESIARSLVQSQESSLGTEVTTHVCYPDGALIRVVVSCLSDGLRVSDGSFGTLFLAQNGVKLTRLQIDRIKQSVALYDCEFIRGSVFRDTSEDRLADSIALVANASRSVADYGIELRRTSDSEFRMSVIERLRGIVGPRLREREAVEGGSGRSYRVGGVVLDKHQASPVAFVEAFATRATISDRFAEFYDLSKNFRTVRMLSIYDDTFEWPKADIRLLEQVSTAVGYSKSQASLSSLA